MAERRRKFTTEDKRRLLEMYDQLPRMSQKMAASCLNITQSVLWTLLRNRSLIMQGDQRVRCGKVPRLEAALWRWVDAARSRGSPVSDLMIHRKAMDLAARMGEVNFRASPTWYRGFKRREKAMRERFRISPDAERPMPDSGAGAAAETGGAVQHQHAGGRGRDVHVVEPLPVKPEPSVPTVVTAEINGGMQTITVPSLYQMKEAMKTLATGLLYRGFCDFKLLHQFEKEVADVVKRSMAQGSQDSFLA